MERILMVAQVYGISIQVREELEKLYPDSKDVINISFKATPVLYKIFSIFFLMSIMTYALFALIAFVIALYLCYAAGLIGKQIWESILLIIHI